MNTKHSIASAYHPQTNGVAERFNRTFVLKLEKTIKSDVADWSNWVSSALYFYNISTIMKLGALPFKILYERYPYDFTLSRLLGSKFKSVVLEEIDRIRAGQIQKVIQIRNNEIAGCRPDESPDDLVVGQVVRRRKTPSEQGCRLVPCWTDPWWITKVLGKGCYWIQGVSGSTDKVNLRDIDLLKIKNWNLPWGRG
ncbi:pol polyprotein [Pseudoloma neurophilia]|uniref:Pol polyprotein n=1 Tax=Pseudoloma neurophilia TaxID=146866 RepID=A0A0R0M0J8_9MICR|nr:pol polyprotein [Pseudoloma neurophilia]